MNKSAVVSAVACPAYDLETRTFGVIPETATFAAGGGDQKSLYALGAVFRERPSHSERFVVGMGQHTHQPEIVGQFNFSSVF